MGLLKKLAEAPPPPTVDDLARVADEQALDAAIKAGNWIEVLDCNARPILVVDGLPEKYRTWEQPLNCLSEPRDDEWVRKYGCPRCGGVELYESLITGRIYCDACTPGTGVQVTAPRSYRKEYRRGS
jgi:hypothetical protein